MTAFRHHPRLPWFALAAIVGMLSMVGEASARTVKGATRAPRWGGVVPRPWECCCGRAKARPLTPAIELWAMSPPEGAGLSAPAVPCECRWDEPTDPASKPESRTDEQRSDRAG